MSEHILPLLEDGFILADKPAGVTSFGVVARVRRQLSTHFGHKMKVGHTGTLDPFATGLMIIVVGKECRNAGTYSKLDKVYEATMQLGAISSTGDPEGEISPLSDTQPSRAQVEVALTSHTGDILQTPPIYSAIKINGERAYKLARKGQTIEMPPRHVTVFSLELLDYTYPYIRIRTHVSSGTYIRSLVADIGHMLEVGAYTTELRRTKVANYDVADAIQILK